LATIVSNGGVAAARARVCCSSAPGHAELGALEREAAVLARLPAAAQLRPRLVDAGRALLLDDPGGVPLSAVTGTPMPLSNWLALAQQLARTLAELHRAGLLHNALRPDVVLWNPRDACAWVFDCGDAAAPAQRPVLAAAAVNTAARLVYVSPEQTGRLERGTDARSDLYSLGVLLYEALTGAPPYRSSDALSLIHSHIAGAARAPEAVLPGLPAVVSELVLKLLAKNPDERYQSASGLLHDLERIAREWSMRGGATSFALGRRDIGQQLVVSARLVGREREVHTLIEAFERACSGTGGATLLLVEGYSGIGKTALIQQLYRPIVRRRGHFISGKFDQVVRGLPFGALIQAFRGLVRELLTLPEDQLAQWRETLTGALGVNGGVLAAVMPEIEFIVGPQPAPTLLGSTEAQNRFQRVLQGFLAAVARPEHPLVLFLDDLQWADAATLGLLEPLLGGGAIRGLLLMGAYRDNELDASPRLARTLAALDGAGVRLERVSLGPLEPDHVASLIAESLNCPVAEAAGLARLVHTKTGGNPFFVIQFLKGLEREGHLRFDPGRARWVYRLETIADAPLADNVIELMTRQIERLPAKSQHALTLAACIGNRFDLETLAAVSEQTLEQTALDLERARAEGLVVRGRPGAAAAQDNGAGTEPALFAFLHDRVQQSAYAMIPAERRRLVHLTVGRMLRTRAARNPGEAVDFDVVHHLNLGRALIPPGAERREIAQLNLACGRHAKAATAHDSALELFQAGTELLDEADWATHPELCFEMHLELAESRYLCGQFEPALGALDALGERARGPIDHARVMRQRSVQFETMARYADALAAMRQGLANFGVSFPDPPAEKAAALERELATIERCLGTRSIAELAELPAMRDPQLLMVMAMLTDIWSVTFLIGDPTLARLISATMVRLSLENGNAPESAYGYVTHAITVGALRGAYAAAYDYGCLALEVNRRFDDTRRRAKIYQQFHAHVNFWCRPFASCASYAREACRSGLDSGDFNYAAYAAGTEPWSAFACTQDLSAFVHEYTPQVALIERLKSTGFADSLRLVLNWARALQGQTRAPLSLTDASLDEDAYLRRYLDQPFFAGIHAVARLHLCTLLGTSAQALEAAQRSARLIDNLPGTVWPLLHEFWAGLALADNVDSMPPEQRADALAQIAAAQVAFETRAALCAENFRCQALLLGAERARFEGRSRDAIEACEAAIEFAAATPLLPFEALALERLGRYRLQLGQERLARRDLSLARDAYAAWGAEAKASAIERAHTGLAPRAPLAPGALRGANALVDAVADRADAGDLQAPSTVLESGVDAQGFDLFSVFKAAQVIAAEVDVDALLAQLLHITVENAGAERGALVIGSDSGALVYSARSAAGATPALHNEALDESDQVPRGIVNYVWRTGQTFALTRAEDDVDDAYVQLHRPRSLAGVPVRRAGHTVGVLVLEHRHVDGVFTPQRLRTLEMLAAQAAISLDNARLIGALKLENAQRRDAQHQLGAALSEVKELKDELEAENSYLRRDLIANVSHDLRTPLVSMRGYLELLMAKGDQLQPEVRRQYLGIAVRQSERLATLIDELFELAKLDFKGLTLLRESFSFAELAADVVQKFELDAAGRQVALQLQAPPRLPQLSGDLGLMERMLDNLIGNALKHTPPGGRVMLLMHVSDEWLHVCVEDNGKGIPPAELPFIFDRFFRGQSGRGGSGAGLGLAITKRIVELHEGRIRAESDGRSGSSFHVSLPLAGAVPLH
jgi:predicted ATPase/signal transduction histidine kinase